MLTRAIVVALAVVVAGCGAQANSPLSAPPAAAPWSATIGNLGRLRAGTYVAASSKAFGQAANAATSHDDFAMQQLVASGQVSQLNGTARVRIIDEADLALGVRVLAAPSDQTLVDEEVWVDPSWVHRPSP